LPRHALRALVSRWIENVSRGNKAEADVIAEELSSGLRLGELLEGLPPDIQRLTIVPDDSLHGFPFAALRHRGRYLTEDYGLTVAFDRFSLPVSPAAKGGGLLAVAVAAGSQPSAEFPHGIPPLPGTKAEAASTADWFRSRGVASVVLIDGDAKCPTVLSGCRDAAFVHIACHGVFRPDRPDASGFVLMPEPDRPVILSLRDLWQLNFPRLRHVTLSNCWLADTFVLPGRMSVSLPEALCRAGAGSVLGCLWPVHDKDGALFMERFYHHVSTVPRDMAVSAARRDVLNEAADRRREPFYWAGFQLYGDPGPLLDDSTSA
jgi:CHAT domain-containing protein